MAHVKRFEERFAERGERIKKLLCEDCTIELVKFGIMLNYFSTTTTIFDGTKTALLTGSGELELF